MALKLGELLLKERVDVVTLYHVNQFVLAYLEAEGIVLFLKRQLIDELIPRLLSDLDEVLLVGTAASRSFVSNPSLFKSLLEVLVHDVLSGDSTYYLAIAS